MRILLLEDDQERIDWFRRAFAGKATLDTTKDPKAAQMLLKLQEYDVVFLDHDLSDEHYIQDTNSDITTGLAVAKFLGENSKCNPNAQIIIHSMNYPASQRMLSALTKSRKGVECIMYPELRRRLIYEQPKRKEK